MRLFIKNMVCNRCIMVVKFELEKLGLTPISVELGEIELLEDFKENQKQDLEIKLQSLGFELLEDKTTITIERIKCLIVDLVHHQNNELKTNLSSYLSEQLGQDYNILSNLFSEVQGTTIEHYFIAQKIEKVKELLMYKELTVSEIAIKLNYSDVAHLSNQFKKITGFTPTHFKQLKENNRLQIDNL
ncbi:helix-turn-helix domain-containing protein [Flavobacterium gawalongense]|uniref:Helix-turn-helix domain-containing protein n=2 Tax=Flavobacterium gawalongense TaxID=2594432 RepID=A0A553BXE8_9FLAO|nr:helix-turn-helix domain-containing protein [Flavobacterium gawalongense]TRX04258.1 helix-turn-helix domain-containing protein [Flavobacterium gawalongense]TRX09293.1 helix-turn-helix domain-containing protein [Flavobacterium gawalongense]TRX12894.1 helix-turn-helix domain-containing protein [Flavobacterium gawalongense]TRX13238.1 helix-turn-helix domain-containing protein [Flavobacterium gawalongense]TRX30700.1 helix-turn-helix domain-containing protein [Flavobacterium gawalongense]